MTSETDNVSHHIHVDGGGRSSGEGSGHDGGDQTHSQQGDDSVLGPTCCRQTQNEFLSAMKEDLGDWLGTLYGIDIGADEFFEKLETGILLCRHANAIHDRLCRRMENGTQSDNSSTSHNADVSSKLYVIQYCFDTVGLTMRRAISGISL